MVQLLDSDIKTREVLDWKGVHLICTACGPSSARMDRCGSPMRAQTSGGRICSGSPWAKSGR